MKTAEELLMEFIAKYASHWINAEDDFPKDLNAIIDAIQLPKLPTENEIVEIIRKNVTTVPTVFGQKYMGIREAAKVITKLHGR